MNVFVAMVVVGRHDLFLVRGLAFAVMMAMMVKISLV